jgi:RHS repeat-associated protein
VIYTSEGNAYLHLPGVIMAENAEGEVRYLLSDGLGSVRQAVDENAALVAYHEFDPYGNPVDNTGGEPYGYTGEWWESDIGLLQLRARWYLPETGTFLSRDMWQGDEFRPLSMNGWSYVEGNPISHTDPTGMYRMFVQGEVEGIQRVLLPWLFDSARRHNLPDTNMGDGAFAALVLSIIKREDAQIFQFHNLAIRTFGQCVSGAEDNIFYWLKSDKSLGPGNVKPSTINELVNGKVRSSNGLEEISGEERSYFDVNVDYNLKPLPGSLSKHIYELQNPSAWEERLVTLMQLQDLEYTIDLVGAQLQQGVYYAQLKKQELNEPNERLGVFNFLTWYNGGVILNKEINGETLEFGTINDGAIARRYAREEVLGSGIFYEALDILRGTTAGPIAHHQHLFNYEMGDAYYYS